MTSAYYYNQQQPGGSIPSVPQQRIPGQIGISPAQGHYIQQQQQQQQQQQYRNQAMNDPNAHRKRPHTNKPSRPTAPLTDDADEPSGDELDDISARDIAMARYKRNHDYLSEIFTPYNAASIVPPPLDISQTKEELDKQIEEHKERVVRQKTSHEEKMKLLEKEQEKFWKLMGQLNEASTLETIDEASHALAKEMGVRIEHTPSLVKAVSIPGIKDEDLIELNQQKDEHEQMETDEHRSESPNNNELLEQQNVINSNVNNSNDDNSMDMFFDNSRQEEENTDSFFNEMVNTDDDPSVNEFLNTE
ncbi:uncharacterized protein EV154DRAFT_526428 [Mucor mucedo]|uniref:uncharacterized protein n=1 Tax=Mucor mucedo TaxID=29922 RepID=UPI00221E3A2A|nr:uncharacterized protein EV154DRAFT_526428 [Mucor mucedo]KAI7875734.1 hypothetical protein EV154DRAFT_526428 [Mucor mucedo]